jgi:enoyl-CoA hydratase/carnithine racemase
MFTELGEAADRAASDPDVRAVLVAGEGPAFCAGIDISELARLGGIGGGGVHTLARTAQRPYLTLASMDKPTVAAVQGHALGAGFQLVLACDLRVLSQDAVLGMLEVRFGLIPDLGGTHRLPALVGPARAKELVWTGRTVGAEEAERMGLANRVVAREALEEEAGRLARELADAPPIPVAHTKSLIERAASSGLETIMERERQAQATCVASQDQPEAVAAHFEKRPARFVGR